MQIQINKTFVQTDEDNFLGYEKVTIHYLYPWRTRTSTHKRRTTEGVSFSEYVRAIFKCSKDRRDWLDTLSFSTRINPFFMWLCKRHRKETVTIQEYQAAATVDGEFTLGFVSYDDLQELVDYGCYKIEDSEIQ